MIKIQKVSMTSLYLILLKLLLVIEPSTGSDRQGMNKTKTVQFVTIIRYDDKTTLAN